MKKILFALLFTFVVLSSFRCNKSEDSTPYSIRDYSEQFAADSITLEGYLDSHKMTVDANGNVSFDTLQPGDLNIKHQPEFQLDSATVTYQNVAHKFFYIKLDEGTKKQPTAVDSVFVSYKAYGIEKETNSTTNVTSYSETAIDASPNPVWFKVQDLVPGWGYLLPYIKSGSVTYNGTNNVFSGYGNIVFFLPSGLGYYNSSAGFLPQYTPLIFSVKLYEVFYRDHDGDKVKSKDEISAAYAASTGYVPFHSSPLNSLSDTDGDGKIDMYDEDDDGDHYLTKYEIRYSVTTGTPPNQVTNYYFYPFDGAAVDDPSTPDVDETRGIPRKYTGTQDIYGQSTVAADYTDPGRLRRHLDPSCNNINK